MTNLGEAYVEVRADTSKAKPDIEKGITEPLKEAEKQAKRFGDRMKDGLAGSKDALTAFTKKAALPATLALGGLAAAATRAAKAAENEVISNERLNAVLTSMGYPEATARAKEYASQLEKELAVADEVVKATQAKLATFANLTATINETGGAFDRATVAAFDLAAAGFGSAETNAIQLGKALQDPIKGITALARSGVTFTAQEKEKIRTLVESNKTLEAQDLILKAIEVQVGGTAKATVSDFQRMKIALDNTFESIGMLLLPVLEKLAGMLEGVQRFAQRYPALFIAIGTAMGIAAGGILAANVALKAWRAISLITTGINFALATSFTAVQVATGVGIATAIAGTAVFLKLKGSFDQAAAGAKNLDSNTASLNGQLGALKYGLNEAQYALATFIGPLNDAAAAERDNLAKILASRIKAEEQRQKAAAAQAAAEAAAAAAKTKTESAAKALEDRIASLRKEIGDRFTKALDTARDRLETARQEFSDFAKGVGDALRGALNFSDAQSKAVANSEALTDALQREKDARAEIAKINEKMRQDASKDYTDDLAKAQSDLAKASADVAAAQAQPMSFFDSLEAQANKVKDFGVLVNRLIAAGLSEDALQQVLSAGVDAGSVIATELLSSTENILRANKIAEDVAAIGTEVGLNAATKFRQAGVDSAQALVDGIDSVISNYRIKLKSKNLTPKQLKKLRKDFSLEVEFAFSKSGGLPEMADGGIVTSRRTAIIGEAGAEAVIPITRPARALQLMEASGLADLVRARSSAALNIENATFMQPVDADLVAQKVLLAERARTFVG